MTRLDLRWLEAEVFAPIADAVRQGEERAMREAGMLPCRVEVTRVHVNAPSARYWAPGELPEEEVAEVARSTEWRTEWRDAL